MKVKEFSKTKRPKNLNLFTMYFPLPAIVSILHRLSGVVLFFFIPFVLWGIHLSLLSEESFAQVHAFFIQPFMKFILWGMLSAFFYHFIAGIRHLLMDFHLADSLKGGRITAYITFILAALLSLSIGVWLW